MQGLSVRTKVFFLFAGAALLTVVPVLVLISQAVEERVYNAATEELQRASASFDSNFNDSFEPLQETARRIASIPEVERLVREGDQRRLTRVLRREVKVRGREVLAIDSTGGALAGPAVDSSVTNSGGNVVFVPQDGSPAIRLALWPVHGELLSEPADSTEDEAGDSVEVPDSVRVGLIGVWEKLDSVALEQLKTKVGANVNVALIALDSVGVVRSTLADSRVRFLVGRDMRQVLAQRQFVQLRRPERLLWIIKPLPSAGNPAAIVLLREVEQELQLANGIKASVVGIGLAALVLALMLALVVSRIVARPAQALAAAATDLARGNFGTPLPRPSGDEIGQLTRAFGEMREAIAQRESRLRSAQAELIHREKLAAMGRLVAQLSHEINNPIYNIQNCLEVLDRRSDPNDPNREFLSLAREELHRMATLTRQMLDQSRPLADAARPLDINQVVLRVLTLAERDLQQHGVRPHLQLGSDVPTVVAHPEALQQVLANLVENAADAMPGGGELRITTRADGEAVEVVVEDTGIGIAPEHLPHIFEAFYTTKPGVSGIGLGLFVSEGIIRGHRGRLSVESRVGEGSRFVIQLPRETLDAALASADAATADETAAV